MPASYTNFMLDALREPASAISYRVSQQLVELFPDKSILEGVSYTFDLLEYASAGGCAIRCRPEIYSEILRQWPGPGRGIAEDAANAWYDVAWEGKSLSVLLLRWTDGLHPKQAQWIVADTQRVADNFLIAVSEWCAEARGQILVFEGGCWSKSAELYESIQAATFENLILPGDLNTQLQSDFHQFFASRSEYEAYDIPWKRGVLFHGPPGNGKTHTLKALVNALGQACLYVKTFEAPQFDTEQAMIRKVFARARKTTPCLLIFEDLDALINDGNRSYFLNELDGFASNTGIVVLATTNHPDRLDPAIVERPSRFDRKYLFPLPGEAERAASPSGVTARSPICDSRRSPWSGPPRRPTDSRTPISRSCGCRP